MVVGQQREGKKRMTSTEFSFKYLPWEFSEFTYPSDALPRFPVGLLKTPVNFEDFGGTVFILGRRSFPTA